MKKLFFVLALCLVFTMGLTACEGKALDNSPEESAALANEPIIDPVSAVETTIYEKIQPLEQKTDLVVGQLAGGAHSAVTIVMEKLGAYEKLNINQSYAVFPNGMVMSEAGVGNAWDVSTTGLGGVLSGIFNTKAPVIAVTNYDMGAQRYFVRNDSDILLAGIQEKNDFTWVGTADTWRGKEVLLPMGTPLHYTLTRAVDLMGLNMEDLKLTHMDTPNCNTAFRAGQGDVVGFSASYSFAEDLGDYGTDKRFINVIKASDVGVTLVNAMMATPKALEEKPDAVQAFASAYFATLEWITSSEENWTQAVNWFVEWNESQGIRSTFEMSSQLWHTDRPLSIEEAYKFSTEKTSDGKMTFAESFFYDPLNFFVQYGSYEPEHLDELLNGWFRTDIIENVYNTLK